MWSARALSLSGYDVGSHQIAALCLSILHSIPTGFLVTVPATPLGFCAPFAVFIAIKCRLVILASARPTASTQPLTTVLHSPIRSCGITISSHHNRRGNPLTQLRRSGNDAFVMASLGEDLLHVVNKLQDLVFNTIGNDSLDLPQIVSLEPQFCRVPKHVV